MSEANPRQLVKFKVSRAPYQIGEVAGFPPSTAQRFIDAGIADDMGLVKIKKPPKEVKEGKKDRKRPSLTKEMVAAARGTGSYVTKDGD